MEVTRRITLFLSHSQAEFDLQKDPRDAWIFVAILVFEERRWQIFAWVQSDSTIDFPGRFQVFPATVALDGWNVSRTVDNAHFRLRGENARELAHRGRISSLLPLFIDEYSSNKPRFSTPWIVSNFLSTMLKNSNYFKSRFLILDYRTSCKSRLILRPWCRSMTLHWCRKKWFQPRFNLQGLELSEFEYGTVKA